MASLGRRHAIALLAAPLFACGACDGDARGHLYVTSGQSDEVVRIDAADGSVVRRVSVNRLRVESDEPHAVAVSPDQRYWFVTVAHGEPSLWKFEASDDRLVGRVDLPSGGAAMIGLSPDGTTAFIPDYDRVGGGRVGRIAAVRLHDLVVTAHVEVCAAPHEAAVHPDGDVVAVACAGSDEIVFLNASDLSVRTRVAAPAAPSDEAPAPHADGHAGAGSRPLSVAWSPDGSTLAVALHGAGAVWLLDADARSRGIITVAAAPAQVAFAGERTLLTANRLGGSLSIVDLERMSEVRRVELDATFPHGLAASPDGRTAFVAYEGSPEVRGGVVAVDIANGDVLWRNAIGIYVLGIAYLRHDS